MFPRDQIFKFGEFEFSRQKGLYRGGQPVPLPHLERQLLKALLDRAGEIVRKEELLAAVWPDTHVAANTLNVQIGRLRQTLGDADRPYRLLRSFSRMGYMLVAAPVPRRAAALDTALTRGDRSKFIRDVTVPDGALVEPGERFEKVWEIQNVGGVPWRNRKLRRIGVCTGPGRLRSEPTVDIPDTKPGQTTLIRVWLTAPPQAGSCVAAWKMIDERGRECFPRMDPLFVSVDVIVD